MVRFIPAVLVALGFACLGYSIPVNHKPVAAFELIAITSDGNAFIAGSGIDCASASVNAVIPENWTHISCQSAR